MPATEGLDVHPEHQGRPRGWILALGAEDRVPELPGPLEGVREQPYEKIPALEGQAHPRRAAFGLDAGDGLGHRVRLRRGRVYHGGPWGRQQGMGGRRSWGHCTGGRVGPCALIRRLSFAPTMTVHARSRTRWPGVGSISGMSVVYWPRTKGPRTTDGW